MDPSPLVVDNGSRFVRVGKGGQEGHIFTAPSFREGEENPIDITPGGDGLVRDFAELSQLWKRMFRFFDEPPEGRPMLMTESPWNTLEKRKKTIETAFEMLNVSAFCLMSTSKLVLINSGRTTGIAFESGHKGSHAVVLFEGELLKNSLHRTTAGGKTVNEFITDAIAPESLPIFTVEKLKQDVVRVPLNYDTEIKELDGDVPYLLPDGQTISIGTTGVTAGETLFNTSLHKNLPDFGVQKCIFDAVQDFDDANQSKLRKTVVLAGGNTKLEGFVDRLKKELSFLDDNSQSLKLISPTQRESSVWVGGSIVSSLGSFVSHMCIQKEFYDEFGGLRAAQQLK